MKPIPIDCIDLDLTNFQLKFEKDTEYLPFMKIFKDCNKFCLQKLTLKSSHYFSILATKNLLGSLKTVRLLELNLDSVK